MYPMQGNMTSMGSQSAHPEPDEDDYGGPSDMDADDMARAGMTGGATPPPTPGMQLAGMSPDMLASAGATGTPGPLQSELQPAMGGPQGAMGQDQTLNMARAQFQTLIQSMDQLAQSYPAAGQQIAQAQQMMLEALLTVGQAVQQVPTAPPMGS